MAVWAWVLVWAGSAVLGLAIFVILGYRLFSRAKDVARELNRIGKQAEKLQIAMDSEAQISRPEANLNDDPNVHLRARKQLLQAKAKKREERQRRLIKKLNQFDPTESRFQ